VPDSEPRGQNKPAGQFVPVEVDPAKQNLPTGHWAHSDAILRLVLSLYDPLGQDVLVYANTLFANDP
jgi:hypothetical protein